MPGRQVWFFRFGCWTTLAAAVAHLVLHLMGRVVPSADGTLTARGADVTWRVLGGGLRSERDFLDGFSLGVAMLLATVGAIGLIVARRARHDILLMSRVARACAVTSVALLAISLTRFSIAHALVVAVMATCFLVASVEAPHPEP